VKGVLGRVTRLERRDEGVWVEAELERHREYVESVLKLVERGAIGWSSGSLPHLVKREGRRITRWPIVEFSLTPTPAEPRTLGAEWVKAFVGEPGCRKMETDKRIRTDGRTGTQKRVQTEEKMTAQSENQTSITAQEVEMAGAVQTPESSAALSVDQVRQVVADELKALQAAPAIASAGIMAAPALKRVTDLGFAHDDKKSFLHWIKTGDKGAVKAALQEDTTTEGGYLVPEDLLKEIIAKRGEISIARACGARVIQTGLKVVDIPAENTKLTNFVLTAEEGAVDEAEPVFAQVQVTAYKYTRLIKVSDELLADNQTNLEAYLKSALGRAWGLTENAAFLTGTGTGEPQGAVVGSTLGKTAASTSAITAAEVMALYYSLGTPYRSGAAFVMNTSVEAAIRALTGNPFLFLPTPQGAFDSLMGHRVFNSASMDEIGASKKTILFGNWEYYALVERQGMIIQRNPYLYQANGQVGIFATVRTGGKVMQSEAFKHLAHPAS
jgi:HK97 family phage major capsid protein